MMRPSGGTEEILDDEILMMIMMMMMTSPTLNCSASNDDLSGAASLDSIIRRSSTIPSVRALQGRSWKYYPHLIDGSTTVDYYRKNKEEDFK